MSTRFEFFDSEVRVATVFDRGRKGDADGVVGAWSGEGAAGSEKAGCDGEMLGRPSELLEWDRDAIGIVRPLGFVSFVFPSAVPNFDGMGMLSEGRSSAAGIGRPRAAAISWWSFQVSEWSFNPRKKGAIRRSIYHACVSNRSSSTRPRRCVQSSLTISCRTTALL